MSNQEAYTSPTSGNQQPFQNNPQQPFQGHNNPQNPEYSAPPGPPPTQQPLARSNSFKESDYVPESERGEQREAMEQFEMSKPASEEDRDLETLQREFPGVDGSLVAALYGDSKSLSGTREMLRELAAGGG